MIAKGSATVFKSGDFSKLDESTVVVSIKYKTGKNAKAVIPVNPLLAEFPADAYGVNGKKATLLICDWHGNEYIRLDGDLSPAVIFAAIKKLPKKIKDAEKKLKKELDKAKSYVKDENIAKAIKSLKKNFKTGKVGLKSAEGSAELYRDLLAKGREKLKSASNDGSVLEGLLKDYKGTELEDEIRNMLKSDVETGGKK